jgi:CRP-like cAMP-binding protein
MEQLLNRKSTFRKQTDKQKRSQIFFKKISILNPEPIKRAENPKPIELETDDSYDSVMKLFATAFQKHKRNQQESQQIYNYLKNMTEFVDMLKEVDLVPLSELLQTISMHILYEFVLDRTLLFRTGDTGEKFYIILKGKVDILTARPKKVAMSEHEYLGYLGKLKQYGEIDLLHRTIQGNRFTFPIEDDDFDRLLRRTTKLVTHEEDPEIVKFRESIGRNSLNVLMTKDIQKMAEKLADYSYEVNNEKISSQDYIDRLTPRIDMHDQEHAKYWVNIFEYYFLLNLNKGDKFGDTALNSTNSKRTATVIASEDTHLGVISKGIYDICIKSLIEQGKSNYINMLINTDLFKDVLPYAFSKKYFSNFVSVKVYKGDMLLQEGEKSERFYFTKKGDYDIYMRKSLTELTEIIRGLGGDAKDFEERHLCASNPWFNKFYNEKQKIRLFIINGFDIVGFDDCCVDGRNLFTVEVIDPVGHVFKLERPLYESICNYELSVAYNAKEYIKLKKDNIITRLTEIRKVKLLALNDRVMKLNLRARKPQSVCLLKPNLNLVIPRFEHPSPKVKKPKKIELEDLLTNEYIREMTIASKDDDILDRKPNLILHTERKMVNDTPRNKVTDDSKRPGSVFGRMSRVDSISGFSRNPSLKLITKKEISVEKDKSIRDYFLKSKYKIRNIKTVDSDTSTRNSITNNFTTANFFPGNDTRINPYYFTIDNDNSGMESTRSEYLSKANTLYTNKAKLYEKQFILRDMISLRTTGYKKSYKSKLKTNIGDRPRRDDF